MRQIRYRKPEPPEVRGLCVLCNNNPQKHRGGGKYKPLCSPCDKREFSPTRVYRKHVKDTCEECGFTSQYPCQFDVDHKDGNHDNNDPDNLWTLCANCHRLKTHLFRDYAQKPVESE
ncbi:hypothetical protein [Burkholderia phage vB_BpP_HN05]